VAVKKGSNILVLHATGNVIGGQCCFEADRAYVTVGQCCLRWIGLRDHTVVFQVVCPFKFCDILYYLSDASCILGPSRREGIHLITNIWGEVKNYACVISSVLFIVAVFQIQLLFAIPCYVTTLGPFYNSFLLKCSETQIHIL
jgi:hypothetical protein